MAITGWQVSSTEEPAKAEDNTNTAQAATAVKIADKPHLKLEDKTPAVQVGEVVTPFIYEPGLQQVWTPHKTSPPSVPKLLNLIRRGQINGRDLEVLTTLFNCKFLTRNQLYKMCFEGTSSYQTAKQRVQNMFNLRLISSFVWGKDETSTSSIIVYCLDKKGEQLLSLYKGLDTSGWNLSFNTRDMEFVFKVLVTNDWLIKLMENSISTPVGNGLVGFKTNTLFKAVKRYIYPSAIFQYKNGEIERLFLLEVVRGTESIANRLKLYARVYGELSEEDEHPVILMSVQDEDQAFKIWETMCEGGFTFLPVRFTTDARFTGLKLSEMGAVFKIEGGEIVNIESEIFLH